VEGVPDRLLAIYVVSGQSGSEAAVVRDPAAEEPILLRGIVRLRNLILADAGTPLADVMDDDVPTVRPDDRAEDAARVLAEYNLIAVPVPDDVVRMIRLVQPRDGPHIR